MSNEDQDRGKKANVSPEHKPKAMARSDVAPKGSVGRRPAGLKGPGLGTSNRGRVQDQAASQPTRKKQGQSQAKDDRPIAVKTGDQAVDKQSIADGHRLMTMDEIKQEARGQEKKPELEGPRISQSDYAKAFRRARDRTRQMQNDRGQEQI